MRNTHEIEEIFNWVNENKHLTYKNELLNYWYNEGNSLQQKATSVLLESFLFYSGFYTPLYFAGNNKLNNVAEIIKLIIKDESVHGVYIGYKFQKEFNKLTEEEQNELRDWVYDRLLDFYENEVEYTHELYDDLGLADEVITFLQYNANKALSNLGFNQLFPVSATDVNPIIINGLSGSSASHDFFSQVGNSYHMGEVEAMNDEDYSVDILFAENKINLKNTTSKYIETTDSEGILRMIKNPDYIEIE